MDHVLVLLDEIWIDLVREIINRKGLKDFPSVIRMKYYREGKIIKEITQKICKKYSTNYPSSFRRKPRLRAGSIWGIKKGCNAIKYTIHRSNYKLIWR